MLTENLGLTFFREPFWPKLKIRKIHGSCPRSSSPEVDSTGIWRPDLPFPVTSSGRRGLRATPGCSCLWTRRELSGQSIFSLHCRQSFSSWRDRRVSGKVGPVEQAPDHRSVMNPKKLCWPRSLGWCCTNTIIAISVDNGGPPIF
jgi:hypothetical protein